jgi:lipopolysaccharide/colanic/teichoic acid biosynthesis glycosyltransferase
MMLNLNPVFTSNISLGRRQLVVALVLAAGDVAALLVATLIARTIAGLPSGVSFASIDRLDVPLIVACSLAVGLYQARGSDPCERLRLRTIAIVLFASAKLAVSLVFVGRSEVLLYCMLQSGLLLLSGFYVELVVRWTLINRGLWSAPTLIVDAPERARAVCQSLALQPELGLRPIAVLSPSALENDENDEPARPGSLPAIDQASDLYRFGEQAEVVLTAPEGRAVIDALDSGGLRLPRPLLLGDAEALEGVVRKGSGSRDLWIKRALDFAIGIPAGILVLPLIGIILLAVKVIDPGPALYIQNRIGRNGGTFGVFKIRSMYLGAEQRLQEHLTRNPAARAEWERFVKLRDDPRVLVGIGGFIRRYSLDELPQLWNVVRGDMSLVGPRPFPDYHVAKFDEEFQKVRSSVTPGLTGLWQVSTRSAGDLMVQRALDLFYIRNWSIWLDLYILLETVPAVLATKGAR